MFAGYPRHLAARIGQVADALPHVAACAMRAGSKAG